MSRENTDPPDPDETKGRALYRAYANRLADAQIAVASRRVTLIPQTFAEDTVKRISQELLSNAYDEGFIYVTDHPDIPSLDMDIESVCPYRSGYLRKYYLAGAKDALILRRNKKS